MRGIFTLLAAALFVFVSAPAKAGEGDLFSLGIGYYDINDNEEAVDFRAEYRWDNQLIWVIEPWVGIEATSEGAFYGVGGLLADIQVGDHFLITPSFGAGLYADGSGKDLGNAVEFRSQLELGYLFDNNHRIGIAGGHISNAGLGDRNPGTEILNVYYHIPVGDWW